MTTKLKTADRAFPVLRREENAVVRAVLAPPPKLTISEWADRYRMLSPESSAEPGQWMTERAPYLRGVMDAFSDPLVEEIVCQFSVQSGKTEGVINNPVGYFIDQEPCPILVVQPTVDPMGKAWSRDRLAPMLRDSPRLRHKVRDPRTRDSGNTTLHKAFPGGHITIAGANSAAGLASRPIRVVLCDEIDRYPISAGTEGDPVELAKKRADTFWNRKIALCSSPTVKGLSRIELAMAETDQRYFHVPCPECGHEQKLVWAQLKWESDHPDTVAYECIKCKTLIDEQLKHKILAAGRWVATKPGARKAGFYLNAIYSPWVRWATLVREWLAAKTDGNLLRVFINTRLAETWEERGESIDPNALAARREDYKRVPHGAAILTAGVDVQGDRLELEVRAWGAGEESWLVAHHRIFGDPEGASVWERLEALRTKVYYHESGAPMRIQSLGVDSGDFTDAVYKYVRSRQRQGVRALKGSSERGKPLAVPSKNPNRYGVRVWIVGTDTAKDALFARLRSPKPGPGYLHFPRAQDDGADNEYLAQFGAEKAVIRFRMGERVKMRVREYIKLRDRNEAIDLYVYSFAALHVLGRGVTGVLGRLAEKLSKHAGSGPEVETDTAESRERAEQPNPRLPAVAGSRPLPAQPAPLPPRSNKPKRPKTSSWVYGYRR